LSSDDILFFETGNLKLEIRRWLIWLEDLYDETFAKRHFSKSALICQISASGSNFSTLVKFQRYPRNIQYITACPVGLADRTGVVEPDLKFGRLPPLKVRDLRLELEQKLPIFKGLMISVRNRPPGMMKTIH